MYFKVSMRHNPNTGYTQGYYRLVESYRNEFDRICHRTLLNIGFVDITAEKLNSIQRILNDRLNRRGNLFEEQDPQVIRLADHYWGQLVAGEKIDVSEQGFEKKQRMVDVDTLTHKDAREVGAEWMCYQGIEQLKLNEFFESLNWGEQQIQLAITQLISRAVCPYSEWRTSRWIKENSAVCEITGYPAGKITKDKLYKSALDLYKVKGPLEQFLSNRTNELFDLQDRIILYDLTNTYFEGARRGSKLAQHAKKKSKEKRDDAKIIVLALMVNVEGFVKFSSVFEGTKSDSSSLGDMVDNIRLCTSGSHRAIVVLDAGIATEENLTLLQEKGYDYVCVCLGKINDYQSAPGSGIQKITSKAGKTTDYLLKVHSTGKLKKERSMKTLFEDRFTQQVEKARAALSAKGGIKRADKVERRIRRIIERYPSMAKHFQIQIKTDGGFASDITLLKKDSYAFNEDHLGTYFIRTNLDVAEQQTLWDIYNNIREIESSFRCLKTDLDLRPIYHKNDDAAIAHIHLGFLAYWLVNTIRYQLKKKGITHCWKEILRITNTQKVITTTGQNTFDQMISVRRCTQPQAKVKEIYQALGYRNYPFVKRKSVVHKPVLKKNQDSVLQGFDDS
jgi:transposase